MRHLRTVYWKLQIVIEQGAKAFEPIFLRSVPSQGPIHRIYLYMYFVRKPFLTGRVK